MLREMTVDDLDDMAALLGDPEVVRYHAARIGPERLVAILDPGNLPSRRVAMRIGLELEKAVHVHGGQRHRYATPTVLTAV